MELLRKLVAIVGFVVVSSSAGCGACGDPNGLRVDGDPPEIEFHWEDSNAMGFYVTTPEAWIPDGPRKMVDGEVFWVLEATSFPGGFESPIRWGEVPSDAKDATEDHGGPTGLPDLQCGIEYKLTVVALRGSDELVVAWDCPPEE